MRGVQDQASATHKYSVPEEPEMTLMVITLTALEMSTPLAEITQYVRSAFADTGMTHTDVNSIASVLKTRGQSTLNYRS
jgi:hypothetical protein